MDVSIGIQFATRELRLDIEEGADEVRDLVDKAFAEGEKLLWLTDKKGKRVAIPLDKLAYVEVEGEDSGKKVGFSVAAPD